MSDQIKNNNIKLRIMSGVLGVIFTIFVIATGFFINWTFTGKDVINSTNDPFPVKPLFAKAEGKVTLTASFCKSSGVTGRTVQKLVSDKTELLTPARDEPSPKGCYKDLPIIIPIPPQAGPGKYHVNYRTTYKTNPFHTIIEEQNSQEFEIIQ